MGLGGGSSELILLWVSLGQGDGSSLILLLLVLLCLWPAPGDRCGEKDGRCNEGNEEKRDPEPEGDGRETLLPVSR